jgi:hypothetical protein
MALRISVVFVCSRARWNQVRGYRFLGGTQMVPFSVRSDCLTARFVSKITERFVWYLLFRAYRQVC